MIRFCVAAMVAVLLPAAAWAEPELKPFPMDWANADASAIDLSGFLDAPAGKQGFIKVQGQHLVRPDGKRFRIWGVNICGPDCFPEKEQAKRLAADLARLGINCVRFHHMDATWGRNPFDPKFNDTRHLDPESMDRLDFLVHELKNRGIYSNINLNVSRHFKEGDGVRDYKVLGYGKSATYFNPRLIELQQEYARQILTHRNSYTGNEYRNEPAVAVVEMVNENSVLEGWVNWRLEGKDDPKASTWSPIPVSYAEELTDQYNAWLQSSVAPERLAALRKEAGAGESGRIPRLKPDQFAAASKERFQTEARFYMELERKFFEGMKRLLKDELKVQPLLVGTADHNDGFSGYAHIQSNMVLDFVDGHGYWEHPRLDGKTWIKNTPMVNDPLDSTVAQFARTPVAGLPYTISEVNHPFPHEFACEGFPILTAYALFHDWDGIYWFTWGRGHNAGPNSRIQGSFDFSNDPVKVTNMAIGGLLWHRQDLQAARETIVRSYSQEQIVESLRMNRKERPFFMPGFARSTALEHTTRWTLGGEQTAPLPPAAPLGRIASDTGELLWQNADRKQGLVTVVTPRAEAIIGFVKAAGSSSPLKHLSASVENDFCALVLTSVDGQPIAKSNRLLLATTAKATNTGIAWEKDRQTLAEWGKGPVVIEAVTGSVTLQGINAVKGVRVRPLSPVGKPLDAEVSARPASGGWQFPLGDPVTTWYLLEISR